MSKPRNVLITGGTGFVGSHLACRMLDDGHHVTVLARGSRTTSARDRVLEALERVTGSADRWQAQIDRLDVLEGDIARPALGVAAETLQSVAIKTDVTWHCAASLSFSEEERDEIFAMNVGGTRHMIDFVRQTPTGRLHHVSTAYVAGKKEAALESEIDTGQKFRNPYEESKCQAELLVAAAHAKADVSATVYRPSVVIGDAGTGRVTHFHGVYAFIRGLWTALERIRRRTPAAGTIHLPLRLLGREDATLNFVPVDFVVNGMAEISAHDINKGGTFHLTNPVATPNQVWLPNICRLLGVEGIALVGEDSFDRQPITKLEALFQKQMAFYYMYLQGEPRFDCRHALEALRGTDIICPEAGVAFIEKMVGWYVQFLQHGE